MTNDQKIQLADLVIQFILDNANKTRDDTPIMIGYLNQPQGIVGFKIAAIGHPVFEYRDRYIIYLESNDNNTQVAIPYYKESLAEVVKFI